MGFKAGAYATVWSVESISDTKTKARITISRKNKQTEQWEQDFGGFVTFFGTATAHKAARLTEKDRIRLDSVDVCNKYDPLTKREFVNYKVFQFSTEDEFSSSPKRETTSAPNRKPDSSDNDTDIAGKPLPF